MWTRMYPQYQARMAAIAAMVIALADLPDTLTLK